MNKNAVPFDEKPPAVASGIRLGTPIVSTRGMQEKDMGEIVALIDKVLLKPQDKRFNAKCANNRRRCANDSPCFTITAHLPRDRGLR